MQILHPFRDDRAPECQRSRLLAKSAFVLSPLILLYSAAGSSLSRLDLGPPPPRDPCDAAAATTTNGA
jgi:hypothetical protein